MLDAVKDSKALKRNRGKIETSSRQASSSPTNPTTVLTTSIVATIDEAVEGSAGNSMALRTAHGCG